MLESQWREKRDDEIERALCELDSYTPEAQRAILAESRRRRLDEGTGAVDPSSVPVEADKSKETSRRFINGLCLLFLVASLPLSAYWTHVTTGHNADTAYVAGSYIGSFLGLVGLPAALAGIIFGLHYGLSRIHIAKRPAGLSYRVYFAAAWAFVVVAIVTSTPGL